MRLINVKTMQIEEFNESWPPSYVILSHRWRNEEVSYEAFCTGFGRLLQGWKKIETFCDIVGVLGWEYAWVDTCCIDRSSSAELSEAINSMFDWYRQSKLCLVYLHDLVDKEVPSRSSPEESIIVEELELSEWFERGWTLQELLAPTKLHFYNMYWRKVGSRDELSGPISRATGIFWYSLKHFEESSVAQRMSWVAKRETTKDEDLAYCLLGIFGVNMPLVYGEGKVKAFRRLQLEILKVSDDETIFAWNLSRGQSISGMLANSPWSFEGCGDIRRVNWFERKPLKMTSRGVRARVRLYPYFPLGPTGPRIFATPLNCSSVPLGSRFDRSPVPPLTVLLVQSNRYNFSYCRIGPILLNPVRTSEPIDVAIYIREPPSKWMFSDFGQWEGWVPPSARNSAWCVDLPPWSSWLQEEQDLEASAKSGDTQNATRGRKRSFSSLLNAFYSGFLQPPNQDSYALLPEPKLEARTKQEL